MIAFERGEAVPFEEAEDGAFVAASERRLERLGDVAYIFERLRDAQQKGRAVGGGGELRTDETREAWDVAERVGLEEVRVTRADAGELAIGEFGKVRRLQGGLTLRGVQRGVRALKMRLEESGAPALFESEFVRRAQEHDEISNDAVGETPQPLDFFGRCFGAQQRSDLARFARAQIEVAFVERESRDAVRHPGGERQILRVLGRDDPAAIRGRALGGDDDEARDARIGREMKIVDQDRDANPFEMTNEPAGQRRRRIGSLQGPFVCARQRQSDLGDVRSERFHDGAGEARERHAFGHCDVRAGVAPGIVSQEASLAVTLGCAQDRDVLGAEGARKLADRKPRKDHRGEQRPQAARMAAGKSERTPDGKRIDPP